eukprot:2774316-Prymnesium_polylepis.1
MSGVSGNVGGVGGSHVVIDLTGDNPAPAGATTTVEEGRAPAPPAGGTSARERTEITHKITMKGSTLNDQILAREKPVENRHFIIPAGWVALHNNADKCDMPPR